MAAVVCIFWRKSAKELPLYGTPALDHVWPRRATPLRTFEEMLNGIGKVESERAHALADGCGAPSARIANIGPQ